ncbi:MAG: signal recognition particle-docking protein FtsY [Alphaproteobacteria bacterium]|nr:signal recognition particle-docking protein FtsY [Alphaproteobacteria bacterium]
MFGKLGSKISSIFSGKKLDENMLEELEELLITSDISYDTVLQLINVVKKQKFGKDVTSTDIKNILKQEMLKILKPAEGEFDTSIANPFSVVMIGVNGSGKTTTIGKLSNKLKNDGKKVSVIACDTFRISATEQLKEWTDKVGVSLFFRDNADPSGLVYDGYNQARAQGSDVIIVDTAGRLANNESLMAELQKIIRTMKKVDENAPTKTVLVLDGNGGQNSLLQMEKFGADIKIDGFVITKTEGSSKSGFVISLIQKYNLPIYFITDGEGVDDIHTFDAEKFIDNLLEI